MLAVSGQRMVTAAVGGGESGGEEGVLVGEGDQEFVRDLVILTSFRWRGVAPVRTSMGTE